MTDFYRRFELSQSLNGNKIFQIARNSAGMVIFREENEKKLKKAIDNYWLAQQKPEKKPEPAARLTKTSPGKFINKSQLEKSDSPRKKTFWT